MQPDVGHEVLWVVRDCLSQEILLARPLLSSTQGDLTSLLQEVRHLLKEFAVPVKGIISDGQETIRSLVAFVFPGVPHQLCQFHYLKDAIDPLYEADRHAKTQLKKQLRGVRAIERALEAYPTPENEAIRGYCLAVRASLTDDGRSPLQASGLRLHERISLINTSISRVQEKKITSCIKATSPSALQRLASYRRAVATIAKRLWIGALGSRDPGESRANDLEHCFGVARVHERRATGRRGAIPGVVSVARCAS